MATAAATGRTQDVLYELPDQGYGYEGTSAWVGYYQALFSFLERFDPSR